MSTIAVDWDGTLVDDQQHWLPYAQEALRSLLGDGHKVIVHSCRANWPEGLATIEYKLSAAHLAIPVWTDRGKPDAELYVDNHGVYFGGDWPTLLRMIRDAAVVDREMVPSFRAPKPRAPKAPKLGRMFS